MFVKCFRFCLIRLMTMSDSNTDDENLSNMEPSQTQNFSQKKKFDLQNGVKMKVYFGLIDMRSVVHFDLTVFMPGDRLWAYRSDWRYKS